MTWIYSWLHLHRWITESKSQSNDYAFNFAGEFITPSWCTMRMHLFTSSIYLRSITNSLDSFCILLNQTFSPSLSPVSSQDSVFIFGVDVVILCVFVTVSFQNQTMSPTMSPTYVVIETAAPALSPSMSPTLSPSLSPTLNPALSPTLSPSLSPVCELWCRTSKTGPIGLTHLLISSLHPSFK